DMVTIEVFDILGRKIQTLANEVMDAGPYSAAFNGENLPNGIYTVKITSGASSEEMKVVLSK
ncbi:MAG TPA: T9SS type A sorting domain-containing protein, partial [Candidatus Kapabacteria bacterium]